MLKLPLRKALTTASNYSVENFIQLVLSSIRRKSDAAKPALKSPFEDGKTEPSQAPFTRAPTKDSHRDVQKENPAEDPADRSSGVAPMGTPVNDVTSKIDVEVNAPLPRNTVKTSPTGVFNENSLPTEVRVMEFEEIPCPTVIKWTSKLLSYIPALGSQVTANFARNGLLPVSHLLNTYGPVVRLSGPLGGPILVVSRPDLLEAVFAEEGQEPEGIGFDSLRHYRKLRASSKTSTWSATSTSTTEPLLSAATRTALTAATARIDSSLATGLEHAADKFIVAVRGMRSPQGEVDIGAAIRYWALESASVAAFGQSLDAALGGVETDVERAHTAFLTASDALRSCEGGLQLWRWFPTWSWSRLESSLDQLHRILGKRVWAEHGRHEQEGSPEQPTCILDALLGIGLHPEAAINAIVEMVLLAGNTTACAGSMLLYELARHPRYQRTVLEELCAKMPSPRAKLQGETGEASMKFVHACIKEALRLHPPVPTLTRVLSRAARLHQYHVPQGTVVVLASAQCARRPDQFEDAGSFRPLRWLEEDLGRHPLSGLPWGGGARACPAASIAASELALLTAKTIRAFSVEHDYGAISLTGEVLARPAKPIRLRFVDRTN